MSTPIEINDIQQWGELFDGGAGFEHLSRPGGEARYGCGDNGMVGYETK